MLAQQPLGQLQGQRNNKNNNNNNTVTDCSHRETDKVPVYWQAATFTSADFKQ
jgi:hypothetical protein